MSDRTPASTPAPSIAALQVTLANEVTLPSRVAHVALLLVSVCMATVMGALLVTEVGLPARTQIALVVMFFIACCWTGYAWWVLARRRVLYARHRVVAGGMALAFSLVFTGGCALLGISGQGGKWWPAAIATGSTLFVVASFGFVKAQRSVRALDRRRLELERALGSTAEVAR